MNVLGLTDDELAEVCAALSARAAECLGMMNRYIMAGDQGQYSFWRQAYIQADNAHTKAEAIRLERMAKNG